MKRYTDLNKTQQKEALNLAITRVLEDIVEGGIRFDDQKNGDDLQARIDKAVEKAEAMSTPWFACEYIMETCAGDIEGMAIPIAEDALYLEHETMFRMSEVENGK